VIKNNQAIIVDVSVLATSSGRITEFCSVSYLWAVNGYGYTVMDTSPNDDYIWSNPLHLRWFKKYDGKYNSYKYIYQILWADFKLYILTPIVAVPLKLHK
jgi:hypothetical protein